MEFLEVVLLLVDEQDAFVGEFRIIASTDDIYLTSNVFILVVGSAVMALLCGYCPRRNRG